MGCTSSIPDTSRSIVQNTPRTKIEVSRIVVKQTTQGNSVTTISETRVQCTDTNSNVQENTTVKKKGHVPIAFAVDMDGNELQRVIGRSGTPKKLKALEPLNVPRFTSEMLAEKQKQLENNSQRLEEKLKKAKLHRDMKKQELLDKQKQQEEYAKRVREKAKKFKETASQDEDTLPWGYSADEGDSDQSSNTQKSMEDVQQTNTQMIFSPRFGSKEPQNDNFFDT